MRNNGSWTGMIGELVADKIDIGKFVQQRTAFFTLVMVGWGDSTTAGRGCHPIIFQMSHNGPRKGRSTTYNEMTLPCL